LSGYVPNQFGEGITIPIPKANLNKINIKPDDFRGITISPVISKVFELCLLQKFSHYLTSSHLQFGFKKNVGCNHAIYSVRKTIEYFNNNASTLNLCTLDLSKAFDKVSKYKLFMILMTKHIPVLFIRILINWYNKIQSCVRWGTAVSHTVKLKTGVRQGGVLLLILFALYIDDLVNDPNNK